MDVSCYWEKLLASEGMPAEIKLLTSSMGGPHGDGLVCVSMSDSATYMSMKDGTGVVQGRDWSSEANRRHHGDVTPAQDMPVARHWREFSELIWASGIGGIKLDFLLDYADHGFLSRSLRRFGLTREAGEKLIAFVWEGAKHAAPDRKCA